MKERFSDFTVGEKDDITVLVKSVEVAKTSEGKDFQRIKVVDKDMIPSTIRKFDNLVNINPPVVATVTLEADEYQGNLNFQLKSLRLEDMDVSAFQPPAKVDLRETWSIFGKNLNSISRSGLRMLVCTAIKNCQREFITKPFAPDSTFSRKSGLLEATVRLQRMAESASEVLGLDKDLMIAGASVYYLGKVDTVSGGYQLTADDALIGLGFASSLKIVEAENQIRTSGNIENIQKLNKEDTKLLCHILNSRCNGMKTAIPEATALRYLDLIVTETELMKTSLDVVSGGETVTKIGSHQTLYKPFDMPIKDDK